MPHVAHPDQPCIVVLQEMYAACCGDGCVLCSVIGVYILNDLQQKCTDVMRVKPLEPLKIHNRVVLVSMYDQQVLQQHLHFCTLTKYCTVHHCR